MRQRHRIFIAINLPEEVKKKLAEYQRKWPELPVRWTSPKNIHITLVFLGYLSNEELVEICKVAKEVASKNTSFDINLTKICYGPQDKKPPRMVWAIGEKSDEFTALKKELDKSLAVSENREFSPHITLGRIRQWEWQRIEPEDRPEVEEDINLNFLVESVEIMESVLKRGGAEYNIIESINLA
ncbi:MAG: RNA 2',3'-cyclic phosphodiesterase [Candidatus Nealsonbacteria bacterium CG10_big_fil_rev_8_21_14_0_10_36_24]|uniref:RNA 2',3'-cyclic phosphodiesterase n=2 Tax=Candidatus Nealsoniibacteriota TaxID=1817911 RepID=A0A2H0YP90_9BACT|nr:MAG: RNA 2',3'-cyclic phosphodiesterase [Candidatus Nealsonbacteria bacterium CG10_big_fil_rev_8_21_14_0_10_36_24]PIS40314.1 MAG: RNA 2',3'-cyclic phosphodiesterase [Candidatus Nealsonbacteria bacterium CG08_land_8_20_14_0_20_36_22]